MVGELYDEKIDIIRWSENVAQFVAESLSPAKVAKVEVNEEKKSCYVLVPDNQLSLAIGKSGQNVRLAARLTGWRIDIRSEAQAARELFESAEKATHSERGTVAQAEAPTVATASPSGEAATLLPTPDPEAGEFVTYDEDVTITADMLKGLEDDE